MTAYYYCVQTVQSKDIKVDNATLTNALWKDRIGIVWYTRV